MHKKIIIAHFSKSKKGLFKLYNKYKEHSSELDLDNGLFSLQIDVGGSKDHEIQIDSEENHLTVKSKDSSGKRHTFGIICPTVEDVDKLKIHFPKDGLLVIDGPSKNKASTNTSTKGAVGEGEQKKRRVVHM